MRLASVVLSLFLFTALSASAQTPADDASSAQTPPPAEAPADTTASEPSEAPAETQSGEPATAQAPAEPEPAEPEPADPAPPPAEAPATKPEETAAEKPAEKPVDAPVDKPAAGPRDRFYVHLNLGSQVTSPDFSARGGFTLYDETATFENRGETGGGVLVDLGGSYLVWRQLYAGLSYSRVSGDVGGPLTAQIPDLLVHDAPRPINGSVADLNHVENAVHFQAIWRHPVNDRLELAVALGPTLFMVSHGLVRELSIAEGPGGPTLTGVTTEDVSDSTIGFNVGVDGSYRLRPRLAVGAFLRYAAGTADLAGTAGDVSLDVGGLQVGVGVRLRFR